MSKIKFDCSNCGSEILRYPSEIKKNKSGMFYCNANCRNEHWSGENNPNYGNAWGAEKREQFSEKILSQFESGRVVWNKGLDKSDPRVEEYTKALIGNQYGRANKGKEHPKLSISNRLNNPMWNPEIKEKARRNRPPMFGTDNPNWRGGKRVRSYRGADWKTQRVKALKRDDYTCIYCAETEMLVVHHIIPWEISYDNRLSNLETVCRRCHVKIEPIGQKHDLYRM